MLPSYSFQFGKPKHNSSHTRHRKVRSTGAVRMSDISRSKLGNIFKSLRHKRLRKEVTRKASLSVARSYPPTDSSAPIGLPSHPHPPDPPSDREPAGSRLHPVDICRSDVSSITSVTEDFPCSMNMSVSSFDHAPVEREFDSCHSPSTGLATSPSTFQLRSVSGKDYLVDRLEQDLQRLSLSEKSLAAAPSGSLPGVVISDSLPVDPPFRRPGADAYTTSTPASETKPTPLTAHLSTECFQRDKVARTSFSPKEVGVPVIVITSVNAKHAKQLQSSARSSKTPLRFSNMTNSVSAVPIVRQMTIDDPFMSSSGALDPDHSFHLPPVPLIPVRDTRIAHTHLPAWCSPETPTRTGCERSTSCHEDLLDVLHSPLVTQPFFLPPFALPPLRPSLFSGTSTP
ncbi:hypothetical protein F5I97DRAFT_234335 [Phlebopus sp. FC_14]|nr:hypothetical protein F5I97DRAFT_234335 [Phlebopus sp. FC_14]